MERFERSGLTRLARCQREGIGPSSLQRWRRQREFQGRDCSADGREASFVDLGVLAGTAGSGCEVRRELGASVALHLVWR